MWVSQLRIFLAGLLPILAMCSVQAASAPEGAGMLFLITVKDRHGFIDRTGKVVIQTRFDYAEDFSEGLAPVRVRVNNKWGYDDLRGYIDKSGEMLIPPRFTSADRLKGGLAKVQIRTKKRMEASDLYSLGYVDRTGKVAWSTVVE
jgi:hypothetical protein